MAKRRRTSRKRTSKARTSKAQSLVFSKRRFTRRAAKAWAKRHGFRYGKVHETTASYRLRQYAPPRGALYRTLALRPGVKAVLELRPNQMGADLQSLVTDAESAVQSAERLPAWRKLAYDRLWTAQDAAEKLWAEHQLDDRLAKRLMKVWEQYEKILEA